MKALQNSDTLHFMDNMGTTLILASTSVFRKQLLSRLGIDFKALAPSFDESTVKKQGTEPLELARHLAFKKAESLAVQNPEAFIIGSDQVVCLENEIFSKAGSEEVALQHLQKLQGQTHRIITAVCLLGPSGQKLEHLDITKMQMRTLSKDEIIRYIKQEQPLASAGSYKIEGLGISLFDSMESEDQTAIIGLPLLALCRMLRSCGFLIP